MIFKETLFFALNFITSSALLEKVASRGIEVFQIRLLMKIEERSDKGKTIQY